MADHIVSVALHASFKHHAACLSSVTLAPSAIPLNVPSVQLDIIRHPGATINSLTDRLNDIDFWSRRYDGIILSIGDNDLSRLSVDKVFSKLCDLARRLRTLTTFLTVCTIEYRLYPYYNRFRVDQDMCRRKVVTINRKIKRFMRSIDSKIIVLGRRCFTLQRVGDGVHLTVGGQNSFCHTLNTVIRAYVPHSSS